MNRDDVQTFLTILESGSVTKAGERLFVSQGTVSMRLKHLEEELGTQLFVRRKGFKQLSLTPQGNSFLPVARQMLSLFEQAEQIRTRALFRTLKICANDQVNTSALKDFYTDFPKRHPEFALRIFTEHSRETYHMVDGHACDIGFCTTPYYYPDVITEALYEAERVIVLHKKHPYCKTKRLTDLDYDKEVHVAYPTEYDTWRKTHLVGQNRSLIEVGTITMMRYYLDDETSWAIVPVDSAKEFARENKKLTYFHVKEAPPARVVYLLTHRNPPPGTAEMIDVFKQELYAYIQKRKSLTPASGLLFDT